MGETEEEGIAIVQAGSDKRVYQDCSGVGSERRAEAVDVSEVEVGGPDGVVDVGVK